MKKNHSVKILILFLIVSLLIITAILRKPGNKIITQEHKRDDIISRDFNMLTMDTDDVTFHIEAENEENGEERSLLLQMKELTDQIKKETGEDPVSTGGIKKQIYLVDKLVGRDWTQKKENLILQKDLVGSRELEQCFIRFLYDCDYWVGYGLSAWLHGGKADEAYLEKYYGKKENVGTLSLFGVYFSKELAEEEEKRAAENTAVSLFEYIKEKGKLSLLLNGEKDWESLLVLKNEWLRERGTDLEYRNENEQILQKFQYEFSEKYPLIIKIDPFLFYINEKIYKMQGIDDIESIKDFETALCLTCQDVYNIMEYLKDNVPKEVLSHMNNLEGGVPCYLEKMGGNSYNNESVIVLTRISALPHEAVHAMMAKGLDGEKVWLNEGLAEYFGAVIFNRFLSLKVADNIIRKERESVIGLPTETAELKMYRKMGGTLRSGEKMDIDKYYKSYVYQIKTDEAYMEYAKNSESLAIVYNNSKVNELTRDWTYMECEQFVAWLIEKYSLETVLEVNFQYSRLEELFGKSLEELHEEWEEEFLKSVEESLQK